jgi:hypothetical protein
VLDATGVNKILPEFEPVFKFLRDRLVHSWVITHSRQVNSIDSLIADAGLAVPRRPVPSLRHLARVVFAMPVLTDT